MKIIIHFIVSVLAILLTAYILPGVHVDGIMSALILAVVLGIINTILRPILIFFTLPLTIVTLGFFILVINALLVLLASYIVPGFTVASFWTAFFFAIVLTIVSSLMQMFTNKE